MFLTYNYRPNERKTYVLQVSGIVGHSPSKQEEQKAKVSYFYPDSDGNIHLYAEDDDAATSLLRGALSKAEKELSEARAAQKRAEQEARDARSAQQKAEQEIRRKKDIWLVANVINRSKAQVLYWIGDEKTALILGPKSRLTLVSKPNEESLKIKVLKFGEYGPPTVLTLFSTPVIGHTPNDFEKSMAVDNYFDIDKDNGAYVFMKAK